MIGVCSTIIFYFIEGLVEVVMPNLKSVRDRLMVLIVDTSRKSKIKL